MFKKILLIVGAIVILVLISLGVYYFVFSTFVEDSETTKQGESIGGGDAQDVGYIPQKDISNQEYVIAQKKRVTKVRTPCDTIALLEYVLKNYPQGTYVMDFDKTLTYNIPTSAVIYQKKGETFYIVALIVTSRPSVQIRTGEIKLERIVEIKNLVGYDASFIDLDSTKLGTAFPYLTLFKCVNGNFELVWEAPTPSHGGFNKISLEKWSPLGIPYFRLFFHYGQGIGRIDYNYFLVSGIDSIPHLLITYETINAKRTIVDANKDKYPDYVEYKYLDTGDRVTILDTVTFVYRQKDSVYVNTRNPKQTKKMIEWRIDDSFKK